MTGGAAPALTINHIHVKDCEGDAHEILEGLVGHNWRFVVRLTQPRLVVAEDGRPLETLFERVSSIPLTGERTVKLSARTDAGRSLAECNAFPARRERMAKLAVRRAKVKLRRPKNRSDLAHLPAWLDIAIVDVQEIDCPPALCCRRT